MLVLKDTRIITNLPHDVATGHVIPEEGMALVYVKEGAETKVRTSQGQAGEIFAGVSFSRNTPPSFLPMVIEAVVDADNTLELPRNPLAGQVRVVIDGTPATIVAGAPAAPDEIKVGNLELIFNGSAGLPVVVQMMYELTVTEARSIIGDAPVGGLASTALGSIGVLKNAIFGTNFFDSSADWSSALYVKTAANGMFTVGTALDHIPNTIVKNSPNAANPFLVLSTNVA